ncbi:MAG TPA: NAD(P)H-dependent glycerol-3-phosphate dehydrogenase [Atopostipes sp.]|nr:NAD(P)H-dependent glycerol-3-phosphate dehydrogenase [Atopostipes sp.]
MDQQQQRKVAVLGAGSWGMALSKVLTENGHDVNVWSRPEGISVVNEINEHHTNTKYFKDIVFPETITATTDLKAAIEDRDIIVLVIPTVGIRSLAKQLNDLITEPKIIVHASKGLEQGTHQRISTIIEEEIDEEKRRGVVVLSGPSHAEEVVVQDLTSVTSASENEEVAEIIQYLFMNDYFRVYRNTDVIGVELGAALKNIIALGAGCLKGLGYGDNAIAALVTRGLAEISRLGIALGAEPRTFMGMSGVGDLIVTSTSEHSRNWRAGKLIGEGYDKEAVQKEIGMAIEGLSTVVAAKELAEKCNIEMPITEAIYKVAYEDADVSETVLDLMRREGKAE